MVRRPVAVSSRPLVALVAVVALALVAAACAGSRSAVGSAGENPSRVAAEVAAPAAEAAPALTQPRAIPPTSSVVPAPLPADFQPVSASFVSRSQGWVLGRGNCANARCTAVLHTTDAGAHWTASGSPAAPLGDQPSVSSDSRAVGSILFTSELDGWIWGPALFSTHDGGATWNTVTSKPILSLDAASGTVWALAAVCDATGRCRRIQVLHSSTANDLWSATDDSIAATSLGVELRAQDAHRWVLAGGMVYGAGTGERLTPQPTPCDDPTTPIEMASAADNQLVVECGTDPTIATDLASADATSTTAPATHPIDVAVSDDAGQHWSTPFAAPTGVERVASNGEGTLVAASSAPASATVSRSTDGGQTWNVVATIAGRTSAWTDVSFTSADDAVAVLWGAGVWASHDGGATWKPLVFAP